MMNLSNTNISSLLYPGIDLTGCRLGVRSSIGEVPPEPTPVMSQGWSVLGKTNDDEDRATVKNLTGNGNNLVLSNFAFAENSGYGLYAHNWNKWNLPAERAEGTKQNNLVNITRVVYTSAVVFFFQTTDSSVGDMNVTIPSFKIRVSGLTDGQTILYKFGRDVFNISENGYYTLPDLTNTAEASGYYFYGFYFTEIQDSCDITIEQIPDYEGYLVTDGVDDKIRSSKDLLFGNDWSIIGDWQFLANADNNCGLIKTNQVWIYNSVSGMNVFLKTSASRFTFPSNKFRALTSDGKIYDENWNQYDVDTIGSNVDAIGALMLGYGSYGFTKIAFKNLAIYNDQILTKEQCISEYNRLQALKP